MSEALEKRHTFFEREKKTTHRVVNKKIKFAERKERKAVLRISAWAW